MSEMNITIGNKAYSPKEVIDNARKAAGWFGAIALFSVVNSVLIALNASVNFVIGLGATIVVDALTLAARQNTEPTAAMLFSIAGMMADALLIGIVTIIWWLSRKGSRTAYTVGMVLYFLDTLIFVAASDWVGMGFHLFFLFMLWGGRAFMREYENAEAMLSRPSSSAAAAVSAAR